MNTSTTRRVALGLLACIGLACGTAVAQVADWPNKRVTVVMPFAPGSGTDAFTRAISNRLTETLKQPFVVDNRAGGGGTIGSATVARAAPDGYTLLIGTPGTLIYSDLLYKEPGYVPMRDLAPVTMLTFYPTVLVAHSSLGISTIAELIALAKAKPRTITYGSAGVSSTPHLALELLSDMAGIELVHVPYRGSTQAMADAVAGQIGLATDFISAAQPHIAAGKIRALGISAPQRWPTAPEIPAIAETLPGYDASLFSGLAAPAGTPRELRDKIAAAFGQAVREPEMMEMLRKLGGAPTELGVDNMTAFLERERPKWVSIIEKRGLKAE